MVHIFSGEEHHVSNIKSLIEVLTSATLTIFQQGNKHLQIHICLLLDEHVCHFWSHIYSTGPRDHPDIAESFMHLHAQVGWRHSMVVLIRITQNNFSKFFFFYIRFLKGSLICIYPTSWMLKHCFTVVSIITCLCCLQVILTDMTQECRNIFFYSLASFQINSGL